jgi:uncharacterized membrane protein SpoIIM required for sporulation
VKAWILNSTGSHWIGLQFPRLLCVVTIIIFMTITIISKSEQQHDNDKVVIVNVSSTSSWQQQQEQKNIMQCNYNFIPYAFMIAQCSSAVCYYSYIVGFLNRIIISFAMATLHFQRLLLLLLLSFKMRLFEPIIREKMLSWQSIIKILIQCLKTSNSILTFPH